MSFPNQHLKAPRPDCRKPFLFCKSSDIGPPAGCPSACQLLFSVFQFAYPLGHSSHWAERTPGPGLVERHDNQAQQKRSQH